MPMPSKRPLKSRNFVNVAEFHQRCGERVGAFNYSGTVNSNLRLVLNFVHFLFL